VQRVVVLAAYQLRAEAQLGVGRGPAALLLTALEGGVARAALRVAETAGRLHRRELVFVLQLKVAAQRRASVAARFLTAAAQLLRPMQRGRQLPAQVAGPVLVVALAQGAGNLAAVQVVVLNLVFVFLDDGFHGCLSIFLCRNFLPEVAPWCRTLPEVHLAEALALTLDAA